MQTVAQGWLVLQLTNSAFKVGLVSTLGSLPILAFTLYGGVLADRVNKHRGIILFQSLMMCEALTLGVLTATGRVRITGRYEPHEAVALIQRQQAALAWLPSIWPETWCYTLTEAWQAGLDVMAFDIGAPADRIRRAGRGWVCPLGISAPALNERLLALRSPAVSAVVGQAA